VLTGDGITEQAIKGCASYQRNVVLRGMVIKRFTGTAVSLGNKWLVEDSEVARNGGIGLMLGDGATLSDDRFDHNVGYGFGGSQISNVLVVGSEVAFNNTRNLIDGSSGGAKVLHASSVTFRNNYVHNNNFHGLHCDTDCINVTFE